MSNFVVSLTSVRSAERNGGGRAYLARLEPGPRGSVNRLFVRVRKDGKNRKILSSTAAPGDVFEARRWHWNGQRQQYEGGTVWFGIQADGSVCMLTREEAFRAVGATAIATSHRPVVPDHRRPTRMVPDDIVCYSIDADGDSDYPLIDGSAPCLLR